MSGFRRTLAIVFVAVGALSFPLAASAQDAMSVVKTYLAAWNAHDAKAAAAQMSADVVYYDASVGTPTVGSAEAEALIQSFLTAIPDASWKIRGEPLATPDGVAFEWTFGGTNTGPWGDSTPATGKAISFDGLTLIRVEGGKITYQGDYYDALGLFKQLGMM